MYLSRKEKKERLKTKNKKKFIKYVYLSFISVAFILFIGFVYERIGEYTDAKRYPPVGEMVDVNNHKINVFSKCEGDKTVVFCSGHETPSSYADFYPLYNEISNYAKVVTYDRPGHGWSEVTDKSRDIDSIVKEMHDALKESGQKAPYILVGHSFASLQVIRFTQIYKNEVSGIVLIDGGNPQYYADTGLEIPKSTEYAFKFLKSIGIARLIVNHTDYFSKNFNLYPDNLKQLYLSMILKTMYNKNIIDEGNQGKTSAETVLENGHLGDMPIKILTDPYDSAWNNTQAELKEWSTNSEQVVVDGAGHAIHHTHPDIINNEILELIKNKI
ncbi:alpha/beta fold hydrolase [Clostridium beijerinckii]|uniref:Putative aminoacrylate hydrolase RutD n=1 Tax=Clostridium beijerinckii TaxID=1520 RepID=A0A1S8S2C2_CLOBE|nr:alpha/beta hydrolase [Clostridium beijerinckii]NRY58940.1 pimeloyl-ACP methyl ester carboxylesterase [Clostridium beijerinckii]OOM59586.1 putative aminoacrylate hydrolase RutD [Clostridium beijerinckii]